MSNYESLLVYILAKEMRDRNYSKIWDTVVADADACCALVHAVTDENQLIDFLDFYGPDQPDEAIEGSDLSCVCGEVLPLAFERGWYKLCGKKYSRRCFGR